MTERELLAAIVQGRSRLDGRDVSIAELMRVSHDPLLLADYLERTLRVNSLHSNSRSEFSPIARVKPELGTIPSGFPGTQSDPKRNASHSFIAREPTATSLHPIAFSPTSEDRKLSISLDENPEGLKDEAESTFRAPGLAGLARWLRQFRLL